jgi:hypothetical protein
MRDSYEQSDYLVYIDKENLRALTVFSKRINVRGTVRHRFCYYVFVSGKYKQIAFHKTTLIKRAKEDYPEYFI